MDEETAGAYLRTHIHTATYFNQHVGSHAGGGQGAWGHTMKRCHIVNRP